MKKLILLIFSIATLFACKESKKFIPDSTGSPYETIVVCNDELWKGVVGDTVRGVLLENEELLNLPEPKFSIVRRKPETFKNIFLRHRNIIVFKEDLSRSDANLSVERNVWAQPQIIITLTASSPAAFFDLFVQRSSEIMSLLNEEEQRRFEAKLTTNAFGDLKDSMINTVGFSVSVPKNYKIRNAINPYFMWLSYEMPISSQGLVLYTYPYNGEELTLDFLVKMRNEYLQLVPGQLPESHMQTSDAFDPTLESVTFNKMTWKKLRGFWNVKNDFMGGPFSNFTTIDTVNNRVLSIDCYVYSPDSNKGQRNYLKQLEAVARTVTF